MPALSTYEANRLHNATFANQAYTPSANYAALCTTTGSMTSAGTEVSGGSYARQPWASTTSPTNGAGANVGALNWAGMPAATVTSIEDYDASTAGNRKHFGALATARTTAAGDTLAIAAGALTDSVT